MLKIGHDAPEFTLSSQDDAVISLGDLRGSAVIVFTFPQVASEITHKQLIGLQAIVEAIDSINGVILGIGTEAPDELKAVHITLGLSYDLLSDPTHEVLTHYDAWDDLSFKARSFAAPLRAYWVIDDAGRVIAGQTRVTVQMCLTGIKTALAHYRDG